MSSQKAYSRLNTYTGKIEWVYPGENINERYMKHLKDLRLNRRSRMETDDEVRRRVRKDHPEVWSKMMGDEKGHKLDQVLKHFDIGVRKAVDDV